MNNSIANYDEQDRQKLNLIREYMPSKAEQRLRHYLSNANFIEERKELLKAMDLKKHSRTDMAKLVQALKKTSSHREIYQTCKDFNEGKTGFFDKLFGGRNE